MNSISRIEQKHSNLLNRQRMLQYTKYATRPKLYSSTPTFKEVLLKLAQDTQQSYVK